MKLPNPDNLNLRDSYRDYKKNVENPLDMKTYLSIVYGLNQFIMEEVHKGNQVAYRS